MMGHEIYFGEYFMRRLENLKTHEGKLYIWGAHYLGLGLHRALKRAGIEVQGFVDKNPVIQQSKPGGLSVLSPEEFLRGPICDSYVLIAATIYDEEIADILKGAKRIDQQDFCRVVDLRAFKYSIEVADVCNLRCISCPRGNFSPQPKKSLMDLATFEKVLDKILSEDPLVWEIELYRWGEPLMNPDLAQMVEATNRRGVGAVISTNLNIGRGLEELVGARPRQIIVSASGYEDSYEETHTGGRWSVFLKNLRELARLRALYHPEMEIELYYHVYKNRKDDLVKMQTLCQDLAVPLRPTLACLLPLDHLHSLAQGSPVSVEAEKAISMQPLPATDLVEKTRLEALRPCGLKNLLAVTPGLEVPACSCWFNPNIPPLTKDFLNTPLGELIQARKNAELCRLCEKERLHHYYLIWHEKS